MQNNTFYQAIDPSVVSLLEQLEKLHLLKRIEGGEGDSPDGKNKNYRGILTKEEGANLDAHIKQMRDEWDAI